MLKLKRMMPSVVIVSVTVILLFLILHNPPHSQRGQPEKVAAMSVQVLDLAPQNFQIQLTSFGTVQPRTQSVLTAQVSGQINHISDNFRDGSFFEKGAVLLTIDDRDYQAGLKIAKAGVLLAKQQLLEEQARVNQAKADWQRLGNGKTASPLVLREPQLAAVKAQLLSAQANVEKAKLALERTKVVAPYAGRILKKRVDVGQVVSVNSPLADIYASDYVEIRLPINNNDLIFANLPEQYRGNTKNNNMAAVTFTSNYAKGQTWQGQVVRTEGSIDRNTEQLNVVAQINDPFAQQTNHQSSLAIKIGQYLDARIQGKLIDNALVIPNSAIYQGSYVFIVQDGVLLRKNVTIAWQNDQQALISKGLSFGNRLVLTPLGQVSSGTPVKVVGELNKHQSKQPRHGAKQRGKA